MKHAAVYRYWFQKGLQAAQSRQSPIDPNRLSRLACSAFKAGYNSIPTR